MFLAGPTSLTQLILNPCDSVALCDSTDGGNKDWGPGPGEKYSEVYCGTCGGKSSGALEPSYQNLPF